MRSMARVLQLYISLILIVLWYTIARGATYYVATTGNDAVSCGTAQTRATPRRTITSGIGCLSSGDTLLVVAGTYAERVISPIPPGSTAAPTIIRSETALGALIQPNTVAGYASVVDLQGQNITFDGFIVDGRNLINVVLSINTSVNITVQNCEIRNLGFIPNDGNGGACVNIVEAATNALVKGNKIHDCGTSGDANGLFAHGVYIHGDNNIIEDNEIYNHGSHGIHQYQNPSSGGPSNNNIIRRNKVHDNGSRGMLIGAGNNNTANHNIVYGNGFVHGGAGTQGINVGTSGDGNKVYNNTVYGNAGVGLRVGPGNCCSNTILRNNISYNNGSAYSSESPSSIQDHNLLGSPNPLFVNAGTGDFHLLSSSPAINAGVVITGITDGFSGLAPDQGAFEYFTFVVPKYSFFHMGN